MKMNEVKCKKANVSGFFVDIIRLNVTEFIFSKSFSVLIFCFFCIKTKESVRVNLSGVYTLQLKTEYGVLMKK